MQAIRDYVEQGFSLRKISTLLKTDRERLSLYIKQGMIGEYYVGTCLPFLEGEKSICKICNREYIKNRKKGCRGNLCNSCHTKSCIESRKDKTYEIIGHICCKCGYSKYREAIDFHHIKNKIEDISILVRKSSLKIITEECKKCIPLCANCHREFHNNRFTYQDLNTSLLKEYQIKLIQEYKG